ncbi:DNA mismatch repair protein MutT [Halalkalibacillus sediminis]|uniref:DNA mismatch repair protein MutT n=1 Tax=Halalkalibacillus sediminis TaxID=2018042 RepID=A0A2I0QR86_9BACI|nr:NUDIX hydrolase [Halalkalibacillus sediminis]PKR76847.1 DNA mismatch repair protein MutT [Halalkalibacillus sediminis]
MKKWEGSSGVCVNENNEILMVLQGKPEETKMWSVPSGGKEEGESFEECCIREIEEETGYHVRVVDRVKVKDMKSPRADIDVEVHYFQVEIVGGEEKIQDPDELIYEIDWKSVEEIRELDLGFPEDREFLIHCIQSAKYGGI